MFLDLTDLFCALFRPVIMLVAIDIIAENIPDIEALNLNDNKLHGIEHLRCLATKLKNLKILYIGDNRVSKMQPYCKFSKKTDYLDTAINYILYQINIRILISL